jgi:protein kinase C substrate 80K-H
MRQSHCVSASQLVDIVFRLQDYFPTQIRQFWDEKVAYLRSILVEHGFLAAEKPVDGSVSRALQKARDAHGQAVTETSRLRNKFDDVTKQLATDCGPDDVFRAIKEDCVSLNTGEYTYEVCIMGRVSQKSNKDNTNTSLG